MRVFAVALSDPNPEVAERVRGAYPECYRLSDTLFLVADNTIAENVAISVGIKGDDRIEGASGVVFKLNETWSGYAARSLWDWLTLAEERA